MNEETQVGQVFDAESIIREVDAEPSEPPTEEPNAKSEPEAQEPTQDAAPDSEKDSEPKAKEEPPAPEELGDIWDVTGLDPKVAARVKKAQALLTQESQKRSAIEKETQSYVTQIDSIQREIARVITSDNPYAEVDRIRKELGLASPQPAAQEVVIDPTGIDTPEKLFAAANKAIAAAVTRERESLRTELRTEIARIKQEASQQVAQASVPAIKAKWDTAIKDLRTEYGDAFAKAEDEVKMAVGKGRFGALYNHEEDGAEKKVLLAAFRELHPDAYLDVELAKRSKKASAVKAKATDPSKPKSTRRVRTTQASGSWSADDILAEVDAELGSED